METVKMIVLICVGLFAVVLLLIKADEWDRKP